MARCARMAGATGLLLSTGVAALGFAAPGFASTDEAGPSGGSSFATEVSASSWYWAGTSPQVNGTALPASAPAEVSNVPAGDRGVGYTNQVDKVTALAFATRGLPAGATFTTFDVRLGLDPAVHQLANGVPALVACEATAPVPANVEGGALSAAPDANLMACAPGVLDPTTQTYTFGLQSMATRWAAGSPAYGVVVRPQPGTTTPFSYAFLPDATYKVTARYTPQAVVAAPVVASPSAAPQAVLPSTFAEPPVMSFTGGATLPVLAVPAALPALVADPVVAPAPVVVSPARAISAVRRVAVGESLRPTAVFLFAGLGLAALLAAAAVVLGDPMSPVAPDARRQRFARVIRDRSASGTTSTPTEGFRPPVRRPRSV